MLDMEIKGYVDLSDKSGNTVLCILCRDGKGKSDGAISLRRPFSKYYWDGHANGDKHKNLLKQRLGEEELIAKGKMKVKKNQSQLSGFYQSAEKNKKYPRMEAVSRTSIVGRDENFPRKEAVSRSIVGPDDNLDCYGQSNSKSPTTPCVGAFNSVSGAKKKDVVLVHHYVLIDVSSKYKWGFHFARPSIVSQQCTGIGLMTARDGGLACNTCIDLCTARGSSNPGLHFLSNWSINLKKCIERRTRDALTESDIDDAERFMYSSDISLNERGMVLKEEASAQVKYVQRMRKLTKILPTGSIKVVTPRSVPSPKSFFLIAHELYLKNPTFSKSILTSLMESMVTQMTNPTKSPLNHLISP